MTYQNSSLSQAQQYALDDLIASNAARIKKLGEQGAVIDVAIPLMLTMQRHIARALGVYDDALLEHESELAIALDQAEEKTKEAKRQAFEQSLRR